MSSDVIEFYFTLYYSIINQKTQGKNSETKMTRKNEIIWTAKETRKLSVLVGSWKLRKKESKKKNTKNGERKLERWI